MPPARSVSAVPGLAHELPARQAGGRQLDASRDVALRQAALELVAEIGYDRLTIDAVAARVKASKATVYRRWADKAELVVDAMAHERIGLDVADTGTLRGDLAALVGGAFCGHDSLYKTRLISGMVSAMLAHPELRDALKDSATPPERAVRTIIDRAVARGEIAAPARPEMVAALLPSLTLHRLIFTGNGPDAAFADAVIDNVVLPALLAGPGHAPTERGSTGRRD